MSKVLSSQSVSVEEIKKYLETFSRFLRRDFLAILVKMTSKQLGIKTVRSDWRTRKGMLSFLQTHWNQFKTLVESDTIFHWYTTNFHTAEKILENRKLLMFLFANWSQYGSFLSTQPALSLLRARQNELELLAESQENVNIEWSNQETLQKMTDILKHFTNGINGSKTTITELPKRIILPPLQITPTPEPISQPSFIRSEQIIIPLKEESSENPKDLSQESSSSEGVSEYDDIVIEDSLDILPFELSIYDSTDYLQLYHIDDPLIIDDYSI